MYMPNITVFGGSLPASPSARASKETQRGAHGCRPGGGACAIKYVLYFLLATIALLALAAGAVIYLVQPVQPAFGLAHRFPVVDWFSVKYLVVYYFFMVSYALLYGYVALAGIKIATAIILSLVKTLSKIAPILVGRVGLSVMGFWFILQDAFDYGKLFIITATYALLGAWLSTTDVAKLAQSVLSDMGFFCLLVPNTAKASILLAAALVSRGSRTVVELVIRQLICKWGALEAGLPNGAFSVYIQANLVQATGIMERAFKEEAACIALLDLMKGPVVFRTGREIVATAPVSKLEPVECVYDTERPFVVQGAALKGRRQSSRLAAQAVTEKKMARRMAGRKSRIPVDPSMLRRSARLANAH